MDQTLSLATTDSGEWLQTRSIVCLITLNKLAKDRKVPRRKTPSLLLSSARLDDNTASGAAKVLS